MRPWCMQRHVAWVAVRFIGCVHTVRLCMTEAAALTCLPQLITSMRSALPSRKTPCRARSASPCRCAQVRHSLFGHAALTFCCCPQAVLLVLDPCGMPFQRIWWCASTLSLCCCSPTVCWQLLRGEHLFAPADRQAAQVGHCNHSRGQAMLDCRRPPRSGEH